MIIFRAPIPGTDEDFIKRLIGMPGDTVEIRQRHRLSSTAQRLSEPYRNGPPSPDDNYGPVNVPPHSYFVLGDNRDDSYDSRYWGFVPESNILGTPVFIYMSVEAPDDAWQPGQIRERVSTPTLNALLHPQPGALASPVHQFVSSPSGARSPVSAQRKAKGKLACATPMPAWISRAPNRPRSASAAWPRAPSRAA